MGRHKLPEEERRRRLLEKHRKYNKSRDAEQKRKRRREEYQKNAERERKRKREAYAARVAAKREALKVCDGDWREVASGGRGPLVSEFHFEPSQIIREASANDPRIGSTLTSPLAVPQLQKGDMPTLFLSTDGSLGQSRADHIKLADSMKNQPEEKTLKEETENIYGSQLAKLLLGSGTVSKEEKKDDIPLEPTVEIKEEPADYYPSPSTSNQPPTSEEFILPHEDNSWTTPSDAVVEPQFTLSVASLGSPNRSDATDNEQPKKKRKTNDSKITTHEPSTNCLTTSPQSPVYNFGEFSNPGTSKEHRKDHFDVFGEYIAAKLRNLDRISCAFAQKAIGDIIFEAEMGKYLNQTPNTKS